jgi:6-phosphogluconolactonase
MTSARRHDATMHAPAPRRRIATRLATLLLAAAGGAQATTVVYVSNADSQEISVLQLDKARGTLEPLDTVKVGGSVMPLAVSPDRHVLYAALRSQPYRVASFAIDAASGRLTRLGESSLADSMANIDTDRTGRWLFAASYGGAKITVNEIGKDGVVGAVRQVIDTAPNAHAIHADAANRFVLATSLGGDNVSIWRFDAQAGKLAANEPPLLAALPKSGPRHFLWDKAQRVVYLLGELDASLSVYAWDGQRGSLRELQRTTTLPPGFTGKPWAADLHLSPDGRFLYASERRSSTISGFRVDPATGLLQPLGQTPTEQTPRGFAIDSSGAFLIVAGQDSNSVSLHAIDAGSGALGAPRRVAVGKNPNWVEIVDLP